MEAWLYILMFTPEDRELHEATQGICKVIMTNPQVLMSSIPTFHSFCKFVAEYQNPSETHGLRNHFFNILQGYKTEMGAESFLQCVKDSRYHSTLHQYYLQYFES